MKWGQLFLVDCIPRSNNVKIPWQKFEAKVTSETNLADGQYANPILSARATLSFGLIHLPFRLPPKSEFLAILQILFSECICKCSANSSGILVYTVLLYGILYTVEYSLFMAFLAINFVFGLILLPTMFFSSLAIFIISIFVSGPWAELVKSLI